MKLERVGKHWERVEWIGVMGERVAVWDWTEKDLEWTGRDWGVPGREGGGLGVELEGLGWTGNGMAVD